MVAVVDVRVHRCRRVGSGCSCDVQIPGRPVSLDLTSDTFGALVRP